MEHRKLAALRQLLHRMERDLGLNGMNGVQRDLLYAANLISDETGTFSSADLRKHDMARDLANLSYASGLEALVRSGLIDALPGQAGVYRLVRTQTGLELDRLRP